MCDVIEKYSLQIYKLFRLFDMMSSNLDHQDDSSSADLSSLTSEIP